jgi:hypothetical protein
MSSFFDNPDWLKLVQKNAKKCRRSYLIARAIIILHGIIKLALFIMCCIAIIAFLKNVIIPEPFYLVLVVIVICRDVITWQREKTNQCIPNTGANQHQDFFEIQSMIQNMADATIVNIMKQLNPFTDSSSFSIYMMGDAKNVYTVSFKVCNQQFPLFIIGDEICAKHLERFAEEETPNFFMNGNLDLDDLRYVCISVKFFGTKEEAEKVNQNTDPNVSKEIIAKMKNSRIFIDYCPIYIIDRAIPDTVMGQTVIKE